MPKTIMHVDLDAFYASVEEREHPEYAGKPVIVGADPKEGIGRGVVSTANYAARKYGLHSAMPISRAFKLCPNAVFVRPDMELYAVVSAKIMDILRRYGPVEQVSVDEAFIDVTEKIRDSQSTSNLANRIKNDVKNEERLSSSIGVGSNKLIAKIASDFKKPDGITIVESGNEKEFLSPLPVRKLLYVGPKTEEHLKGMGIKTIGKLAEVSTQKLLEVFGKFGAYLHDAANGRGDDEVSEYEGTVKSINRNITFDEDTLDPQVIESALNSMAEDIHESLLEEHLSYKTVGIRVRFKDFETFTRAKTINAPSQDLAVMRAVLLKLIQPFYSDGRQIRQVGARVSSLSENSEKQKTVSDFFK